MANSNYQIKNTAKSEKVLDYVLVVFVLMASFLLPSPMM